MLLSGGRNRIASNNFGNVLPLGLQLMPMIFQFQFQHASYTFNTDEVVDLSLPIRGGNQNPNAYYIDQPRIEPFRAGGFVGSVAEGGACNCEDIFFNAHGNGTHTEGIGHITAERIPVYECLSHTHCIALLASIQPINRNGDMVITKDHLTALPLQNIDAVIIRTLPNTEEKKTHRYSGSNPAYLLPEATAHLNEMGVQHLLLDLPSVDREEDGGALQAHKAFWGYPEQPRKKATITEMIYVPEHVADGMYLLNIQIASFHSDASPSRPMIFKLTKTN